MGFDQIVASAYLDNISKSTVRLVGARPDAPYNVSVVRARVVPVRVNGDPHGDGLWGAFRWPRTDPDDETRQVFDRERPVKGFVLPARSRAEWMVTLQYRQRDTTRSMSIAGVVVDYTRLPTEIHSTTATLSAGAGLSAAASSVPRAEWSLIHYSGDRYQLENTGTGTAWHVRVDVDSSMVVAAGALTTDPVDIPPREAQTFIALRTMGTRDSTVTVTWRASEDSDEEQSWRYPLPPKH